MTLKKFFKQYIEDPEKRLDILYKSSKHVFLVMAFMFFLSYFCISAGFYDEYFTSIFLPLYVGFIVSLVVCFSMITLHFGTHKVPKIILGIICLVWGGLGAFFLIPIL